jgi:hypothetical protein
MKTIGTEVVACCNAFTPGLPTLSTTSGDQQLSAEALRHFEADNAPPVVDLEVATDNPSQLLQTLSDCRNAGLRSWIIGLSLFQPADASHPIWLLRVSTERPSRRSAADKANKFAPSHCPSQSRRGIVAGQTGRLEVVRS